jgi:ribosome-associated heat shock protein Hsp15
MRLDVWLDVTCLFKTRSEAKRACEAGKVDVNGQSVKPHRDIKAGDELEITRGFGRRQKVIVRGLAEQHLPKAEARLLYEDVTPKPSAEEVELLRMARLAAPFVRRPGTGAPDKRERRQLRRLKGRG